ncbi:membrane AbrB-like protein [Rubrivivax gelatinosus]|uniref:AbrB family transcriptional regulator n=1 Tax=Rubrivivax gelatinosus TaxID=28068 RepID=UPI0018C92D4C|nr:AbrB family transcriptional regulator [Rubrivivax gelatinosus]MBG6080072.1 membrane AbrB-like protein [Rubrivivax gelatinosus]
MPPAPEGADSTARARRIAATLALAVLAALGAQAVGLPLPWMLGPLLATAAFGVAGRPVAASQRLRNLGLALLGVALGLYFTPPVVALIGRLAPAIAAGVVWALALGYLFYRVLLARHGGERATCFYAAAIGGASEMALLAERAGGRVDQVAAAHSLRVLLVVTIVPVALKLLGVHGLDAASTASATVRPLGLLMLAAGAAVAVWILWRLKAPNPWVLGPLLATALPAALGAELSALPPGTSGFAQLVIGVALGIRFTPEFAHAAPRWLASVAAGTLAMLVVSGGFAALLARATGLHPATALLATTPGGIAEMAITAKVLQLGVPVVTAFQVVRYVAVLTLMPVLYRAECRRVGLRP